MHYWHLPVKQDAGYCVAEEVEATFVPRQLCHGLLTIACTQGLVQSGFADDLVNQIRLARIVLDNQYKRFWMFARRWKQGYWFHLPVVRSCRRRVRARRKTYIGPLYSPVQIMKGVMISMNRVLIKMRNTGKGSVGRLFSIWCLVYSANSTGLSLIWVAQIPEMYFK